jgi:hypothetical protein
MVDRPGMLPESHLGHDQREYGATWEEFCLGVAEPQGLEEPAVSSSAFSSGTVGREREKDVQELWTQSRGNYVLWPGRKPVTRIQSQVTGVGEKNSGLWIERRIELERIDGS